MLKKLPKILSGDLLKALCDMGHGDILAIVDSNYPAHTMAKRLIEIPGTKATDVLKAIIPYFQLDHIVESPALLMAREPKDIEDGMEYPSICTDFKDIIHSEADYRNTVVEEISRDDFYNKSRNAYVIIQTGEERLYGDILLIKGPIK